MLKRIVFAACAITMAAAVVAKLPPPTPEEQAAAALNAAKAAHNTKVEAYLLCQSQNKVADAYLKDEKAKGKTYTPEATPACTNPGPFVPPTAAAAAAPAPAAAAPAPTAAAPSQPAAAPAKK
jgi:acyl-CoA synthetase (AMP-forming)/AMP-acid ligase II